MKLNKEIYFAGGCFWGVEEYFSRIPGVTETQTGYANGNTKTPNYEDVCYKDTGHAEAVKVIYDPEKISLKELAESYFKIIDPCSINKQGNDVGIQYRTGIYYTDDNDEQALREAYDKIEKRYTRPLAVELKPLENFYPAEEYHQKYLKKNPGGYCHIKF